MPTPQSAANERTRRLAQFHSELQATWQAQQSHTDLKNPPQINETLSVSKTQPEQESPPRSNSIAAYVGTIQTPNQEQVPIPPTGPYGTNDMPPDTRPGGTGLVVPENVKSRQLPSGLVTVGPEPIIYPQVNSSILPVFARLDPGGVPILCKDFILDITGTSFSSLFGGIGLVPLGTGILTRSSIVANRMLDQFVPEGDLTAPTGTIQLDIYTDAFIPEPWISVPPLGLEEAKGDNRRLGERKEDDLVGSSRVWTTMTIMTIEIGENTPGRPVYVKNADISTTTHRRDPGIPETKSHRVKEVMDPKTGKVYWQESGRGQFEANQDARKLGSYAVYATISVSAKEGLWSFPGSALLPAIDYSFGFLFIALDDGQVLYSILGEHDGFPNYEIWIQDELIYGYDHRPKSKDTEAVNAPPGAMIVHGDSGPWALAGGMEIDVKHDGTVMGRVKK